MAIWRGVAMGLVLLSGMTSAGAQPVDPALLHQFEQTLASTPSATVALARWCRIRGLASDPVIRAQVLGDTPPLTGGETRTLLGVGAHEPLGYRHVRLLCGDLVLSDARNWYVPARLTPAMNHALTATDSPFGAVIAPFRFTRQVLDSHSGTSARCPEDTVVMNRALIRAHHGETLALVVECYPAAVLHAPR